MFERLREEERKKVQLFADAMQRLGRADDTDFSFYLRVVQDNTTVPVVIVDANREVKFHRNLDSTIVNHPERLRAEVDSMATMHPAIEIAVHGNQKQFLYYSDSKVFTELQEVMEGIIRSFISETVMSTASVPLIYTDSTRTRILETANIEEELLADTAAMLARTAAMAQANAPIAIDLPGKGRNFIFYEETVVIRSCATSPTCSSPSSPSSCWWPTRSSACSATPSRTRCGWAWPRRRRTNWARRSARSWPGSNCSRTKAGSRSHHRDAQGCGPSGGDYRALLQIGSAPTSRQRSFTTRCAPPCSICVRDCLPARASR
ncbi:MAG: hypothetical protein IPF41_02760 [Flavobacteriales bacterium]|nr:hypothetical protein [Flavobacteriales bacterium]